MVCHGITRFFSLFGFLIFFLVTAASSNCCLASLNCPIRINSSWYVSCLLTLCLLFLLLLSLLLFVCWLLFIVAVVFVNVVAVVSVNVVAVVCFL